MVYILINFVIQLVFLPTLIFSTFTYHLSPMDPNDSDSCISYTNTLNIPPRLTICMRYLLTKHQRVNPHFFQIGSIDTKEHVAIDGFMFGIYNHVPWFGMVRNSRENLTFTPRDMEWFEFDKIEMSHYNHVWRHICITMDFVAGKLKVVDNRRILGEVESEKISLFAKLMQNPVEYVNLGCYHTAKVGLISACQLFYLV